MKKRKLVNKKGISLVVAMALSIFLLMITGTFLSVSILQQEDTGSEMNTRQAYVDAKSNLQTAEDFLKSEIEAGNLSLPSEDASIYVVLYYDSTGKLCYEKFNTADGAKDFIENFATKKPGCTLLSDTYIKITNNGGGSYTMSAFSAHDKYTTDSESFGDLSINFNITEIKDSVDFDNPDPNIPKPVTNSNRFLMVGLQTNFSLMNSVFGDSHYNTCNSWYTANNNTSRIFIIQNEARETPINSYFPIIYTDTVQVDSSSDRRCIIQAYNEGIYFLGNYSGDKVGGGDYKDNPKNICYYTNNPVYGATLNCSLVTFAHNVVCRSDGSNYGINLNNYGTINKGGVVVHLPNANTTFRVYNQNGDFQKEVKYTEAGYYWLPESTTSNQNNIFTTKMVKLDDNDERVKNVKKIDMFEQIADYNTATKTYEAIDVRGGFEQQDEVSYSIYPNRNKRVVSILNRDGKFNTGSTDFYSKNAELSTMTFRNNWDNTSIYCGPSKAPESIGNYYMYCGKTLNYLWNNINPMVVENGVNMYARSNNVVLTFGMDATEYTYYDNKNNSRVDSYFNLSGNNVDSYKSSNVLKSNGGHFYVCPYMGQNSFQLTVINDIYVDYNGGYTISAGVYEIKTDKLDLFSETAQKLFKDAVQTVDADETEVNWVKSNGEINNYSPNLNAGNVAVDFVASSGNLYNNGTYVAKRINCDFSSFSTALKTNTATLKADKISIDAPKGLEGSSFTINTTSANSTCKINGAEKNGQILTVVSDMKLTYEVNTADPAKSKSFNIKAGTYFFTTTEPINIMNESNWNGAYIKYSDGTYSQINPKTEVTLDEGKYY